MKPVSCDASVAWRAVAQRSRRLAASSLCGLACLSCLDDAPEFPERRQIPPFVLMGSVVPPVSQVYSDGFPIRINVPFRSEDVNEDVTPALFLDLEAGESTPQLVYVRRNIIPASTYDDEERFFFYEVGDLGLTPGCRTLTLILTYDSNMDAESNLPLLEERTARVIWWLDLSAPSTNVLLRSCPHSN